MTDKSLSELEKDYEKKDNESCFLPDKKPFLIPSIIMLDIISIEDFKDSKKKIHELYDLRNNPTIHYRLKYIDEIINQKSRVFSIRKTPLPYISHTKFKGRTISDRAFHDLGEYIDVISIELNQLLPSYIIMQIQVHLNNEFSEKINRVLYKYHNEEERKELNAEGIEDKFQIPASRVKQEEIQLLIDNVKRMSVTFLRKYFNGCFLRLDSKQACETIPFIYNYIIEGIPTKKQNFIDWTKSNYGFFGCFNMLLTEYNSYIHQNFILSTNDREKGFRNLSLVHSVKKIDDYMGEDNVQYISEVDSHINDFDFFPYAISRWMDLILLNIDTYAGVLSQEFNQFESISLSTLTKNRETFNMRLFNYNRFIIEYQNRILKSRIKLPFKEIIEFNKTVNELFAQEIDSKANRMKQLLSVLRSSSKEFLELKNVKYNHFIQEIVKKLTYVAVGLGLLQIFIALIELLFNALFH